MSKLAAIYVRVSTEKQAEKVSPEAQESDCRALCERNGYQVVEIYRDTEKYRSRNKMVEPSGTRADRPQFRRMLADARAGRFDVIVAWREDRLYRGIRPSIEVSDTLDECPVTVELVRESFDRKLMGLKAAIAKMEIDAIKERTSMGISGRLNQGRLYMAVAVYGYDYDPETGTLIVNESEAEWVRRIWQWYAERVGKDAIRKRLIAGDAPQKNAPASNAARVWAWSISSIDNILKRDGYATGVWTRTGGPADGSKTPAHYEFTIPTIVDPATYAMARERRAEWKSYPAANWKHDALLAGHIYCANCGVRLQAIRKMARGKYFYYYVCKSIARRVSTPECCKSVRQSPTDTAVWDIVRAALTTPGYLEDAIQAEIDSLQTDERDVDAEISRLERQLSELAIERQRIIGFAAKGIISEGDLETQLFGSDVQRRALETELNDCRLITGRADSLRGLAEIIRAEIQGDTTDPDDDPAAQFAFRRGVIAALNLRVEVETDKTWKMRARVRLPDNRTGSTGGDGGLLVTRTEPRYYTHEQQTFAFALA